MALAGTRVAVVGAGSLLGKELAEQLNEMNSPQWDIHLLDIEEIAGQVTAAGDEALVVQALDDSSFTNMSIVFFAGDKETARQRWRQAEAAGASVIDLTGALEGEAGVHVLSPLVSSAGRSSALDLSSVAVVSAHPAAVLLGAVLGRLHAQFAPFLASVTLLEPASQQDAAGMDEMHAQTVNLLSFKPLPQEVFDTQVAFNLSAELGSAARSDLEATAQTIRRHLSVVAGEAVSKAATLQLVQAPVFSGYTASIFVATATVADAIGIERALASDSVTIPSAEDPSPSNQAAAQQGQILARVRTSTGDQEPKGFWLWLAADNLRLAARNAIACAAELLALRPSTRIQ